MDAPDELRLANLPAPRAEFLGALLRGLGAGTRRLAERLERDPTGGGVEASQTRLGWGWAVANELAGEGGAPERREPRGAAWLARCFEEPELEAVAGWPRVRPRYADWRAAYALVLVTRAGLRAGAVRAGRRSHDGGCAWWLGPLERPVPTDVAKELRAIFAEGGVRLEQVADQWAFPLPAEWRLDAGAGGR